MAHSIMLLLIAEAALHDGIPQVAQNAPRRVDFDGFFFRPGAFAGKAGGEGVSVQYLRTSLLAYMLSPPKHGLQRTSVPYDIQRIDGRVCFR